MKKLIEIQKQREAEITEALQKYGAFFAFSDKQFLEGKKEGITYCNMGAGLIAPKESAKELREAINLACEKEQKEIREKISEQVYIQYEVCNHEGSYEEAIDIILSVFPDVDKQKVSQACYKFQAECW